jgi:hypothetical protein
MLAKQSTALTVVVGPILDSTGAEYASAVIGDLSISKNGGTLTAMASAATLTYIANGMYTLVTTTGNMDTLGAVQVTCNKATYQMPKMERNVVPASVYDAIIANATNTTGGLPTATAAITGLAGVISTYAGGAVASVTNPVTVGTNNDKTGYTATVSDKTGFSLTPTTGLGNQTANITGNLSGTVGSVTGSVGSVASFGTLVNDIATAVWGAATRTLTAFGFNVNLTPDTGLGAQNGSVATVNTVLELDENALTANDATDSITSAVWDAPYNQHTTAGSFGRLMNIIRKANTVVEGTVTSAVTPTATSFSSNVNYPTGAFKHAVLMFEDSSAINEQNSPILTYANTNGVITVEEPFTVAPTVGDKFIIVPTNHVHSIAAIADGVWDEATSGHTTAGTTGKALIDSGAAGNPWSTDLAEGYSGTEAGNILNQVKLKTDTITGNQTINVYPVSASTPERVAGTTITYYRNEIRSVSVVTDFTLTSLTLSLTIEDAEGTDLLTIANAQISRSGQTFTVSIGTSVTSSVGNKRWALRDLTGGTNSVIARGVFSVQEAASA